MDPRPAQHTRPPAGLLRVPGMVGLLVVSLCGFTSYAVALTTAPLWAARGGASAGQAGLVTGVLMLATVATQLTVPAQIARIGMHGAMAIGLGFLGTGSLLYLASDDLAPVLAVSALRGLGFATLTVAGSTAVAHLAPPRRLGAAIGAYGLVVAVPNVLGLPAGVWIAEHLGFEVVFGIGAAPLLAIPVALVSLRGVAAEGSRTQLDRALLRRIAVPCLTLFAVTLAGGALMTFVPLTPGLGGWVSLSLLLFGVAGAVGRWYAGRLTDRVGPGRVTVPFLLTTTAGMLCVAAAAQWPGAGWLVLVGGLVAGTGYGAVQSTTLVAAMSRAGGEQRAGASALWNGGFDLGTGAGGAATGVLIGLSGYPAGYAASAVLVGLLAVTLLAVRRTG